MTWWHRLLRRKQMEEELEKELRFHLDQHAADLIARGHALGEARRQARLAFGGPEQVKEGCRDARGMRWVEDLVQDVRYALRTLRQRPGFTAIALCTLALGIGATTVMFTVLNGVLLEPLSYPEPDKLFLLHEQTEKYGGHWGISYPNFRDCQKESRSLTMAAWNDGGGIVREPGEAAYTSGLKISSGLFSVFGVPLFRGRTFLPEEDRPGGAPVAIISYGLWQRRYGGNPSAIGLPLIFDGRSYTVIGIAPAGFPFGEEVDVFTPLGQNTDPRMHNRQATFLHVVARLRPGATRAEAGAELSLIGRHLAERYPKSNAGRSFIVQPLRQELVGDVRPTLWLLLGAVGVVLSIACANVASLLLARAVSRGRELAVRVALGAGRSRLARQCLTESAVLALCGGLLGILLASIGIRPFVTLWPGGLPRAAEVHLDWHVLLFAMTASLLTGLLFGLAPALRAPVQDLERALRAGSRTIAGSSRRLHSGFVASEIALAVVLLVSAGMLGRTLLRLSYLDPGMDIRNVLTARVAFSAGTFENPSRIREVWRDVMDRARRVPGVQSVALADIIPMREGMNELGYWTTPAAPDPSQLPLAVASSVTPDYLQVMHLPLRQGRFFTEEDRLGTEPVVVIDEVLARHAFGGSEAVGKRLQVQALGPARVVGVVGHVRHWGLAGDDQAQVRAQLYYPFAQVPDRLMGFFSTIMSITIRTSVPPLSAVEPLRRELRGAQVIYEVRTMEQLASGSLARQSFLLLLFGIFAGLALLLACLGIYGVLSYLTRQRVQEIGVRMAFGASSGDVVRLVLRQSLGIIFVGVGVGVSAALVAARVMVRSVDGMRPVDTPTVAVTTSVLIAAALFASFLPARHASRVDPMKALRQE